MLLAIEYYPHYIHNIAKNVGSGTQTIAPIKQTEKGLGPVGSVFLIIF